MIKVYRLLVISVILYITLLCLYPFFKGTFLYELSLWITIGLNLISFLLILVKIFFFDDPLKTNDE